MHDKKVGTARVPVADVDGEKFPKALSGFFRAQEQTRQVAGVCADGGELVPGHRLEAA